MGDTATADFLQTLFERQQNVTTWHERGVQARVEMFAALREANGDRLRSIIEWKSDRDYIIDPLAGKIAEAFADLLYGEDPAFTSAEKVAQENQKKERQAPKPPSSNGNGVVPTALLRQPGEPFDFTTPPPGFSGESSRNTQSGEASNLGPDETPPPDSDEATDITTDQDRLEALVEANQLPSELREAEMICSSEGEVWYRIYRDLGQSDYPIIEWHSRSHIRPLFRGRRLIGAAIVEEIFREEVQDDWEVWRYVEVHTDGYTRNLLYKGTPTLLGQSQDLSTRPETSELEEDWEHDLGMLCGRIPNKLGKDRRYGISDYEGIKDLLLSLNEATTIGHENARLTLKRRVVVPQSALDREGEFDASEDVLIADADDLDQELGRPQANQKFTVLEYSFDANALISYKSDLASIILTRVGIAEQFILATGRGGEGSAQSGTSLRLRLIPTTLAANGKARFHDDALPKILLLAQLMDSLPEERGGFGRTWNKAAEPPTVERSSPLPEDEQEEVLRHVAAVNAELESRLTAIKRLNPDFTDEDALDELRQIAWESQELGALSLGSISGGITPPGGGPGGTPGVPGGGRTNRPGQPEAEPTAPGQRPAGSAQPGAPGGGAGV